MSSRRVNEAISRHVTAWFHREGYDGSAPDTTVQRVCTLFLEMLKRCHLTLFLSEGEFRRNICEAICTMYRANKQNTTWIGPNSDAPRPYGWTSQNELDWKDWLSHEYFSYEVWGGFWAQINEGNWESAVPRWRDSMEYILLHYVNCEPDVVDSYVEQYSPGSATEESREEVHHHDRPRYDKPKYDSD
jgi:hypothetical protein